MDPAESLPPGQESALTQPEVEQMLSEAGSAPHPAAAPVAGDEKDAGSRETLQRFDFRQPAFLTPAELRKLRQFHEEFVRSLAARLSMYLRLEVNLQTPKLQTTDYQKFIGGLRNPTYLTLFKVEPLRGVCVLDLPPRLGLTLVDRLMGGPARSTDLQREMSEIEMALLDQVVQIVVGEWCTQWSSLMELRGTILGHETNGRFLEISPRDPAMLVVTLEVRLGDCTDQIQMGFPCQCLEPLIARLSGSDARTRSTAPLAASAPRWNPNFEDVKIPITAEWHGLEITVRQLARLKVGDVLELGPESVSHIQLRLSRIPKFVGRLGTRGNRWAVEATQILKS